MFSYYGAKTNIAHRYPRPIHGKIIEPFAGSARYALRYFEKDVLLIDLDPAIIAMWHFLQKSVPADIFDLHIPATGQSVDDITYSCPGEKLLVGFIIGYGNHSARKTRSEKYLVSRPNWIGNNKKRIADNLFKIKHWDIRIGDYKDIPDQEATWFIDPPYYKGGWRYRYNKIDYGHLAGWCMQRSGQVIVCEQEPADWLPFIPFVKHKGAKGMCSEVVWYSGMEKRIGDGYQLPLFY